MESISNLLKELEPLRKASNSEACQALLAALWRRTHREVVHLSDRFAAAGMANIAAMCRKIAAVKAQTR